MQQLLTTYLGLSVDACSPLRMLRELGLQRRIGTAQRELLKLHAQEQQRLLSEAARIVSHQNLSQEQRQRARSIWAGPLLTMPEWRVQCREELFCGRAGGVRTPRILRRILYRELPDWPSAGDLMRAALNLQCSASLELDVIRASFVEGCEENLAEVLEELWARGDLGPDTRIGLLRSLAVVHEAEGEGGKAIVCWTLISERERDNLLALLSRFSLAVSVANAMEARMVARAIERCVRRCDPERVALGRAIRERKWISRIATVVVRNEARRLRLDLLGTGQPMLSELCLELA